MKSKFRSQGVQIDTYQTANMRIGKISSSAEFWMSEQFQNLTIFKVKFWVSTFEKISIIFLIFQIVKLGN